MPNTNTVRSFKKSGMAKNDGGVPFQGISPEFNTTYPSNEQQHDAPPINEQYKEKLPTSPTPLGGVDLGSVSTGGK